jgi:hypothetical protein
MKQVVVSAQCDGERTILVVPQGDRTIAEIKREYAGMPGVTGRVRVWTGSVYWLETDPARPGGRRDPWADAP